MSNKRIALVRIYLNKMRLECKAALPQEMLYPNSIFSTKLKLLRIYMLKSQDDVEQTHNAEKIFKYEESAFLLDHEESNIIRSRIWSLLMGNCLSNMLA